MPEAVQSSEETEERANAALLALVRLLAEQAARESVVARPAPSVDNRDVLLEDRDDV